MNPQLDGISNSRPRGTRFSLWSAGLLVVGALAGVAASSAQPPPPVPSSTAAASSRPRHLLYLHGRIVQVEGSPRPRSERFGYYEYEEILAAFRSRGFLVESEIRPRDTTVESYAAKVVDRLRALIATGIPSSHITVVGASMGGSIALRASGLLDEPAVHYAVLGACNSETAAHLRAAGLSLHGDLLFVVEDSDEMTSTCQPLVELAAPRSRNRELRLRTGLGHGFLYRPLPEWVDPVAALGAGARK